MAKCQAATLDRSIYQLCFIWSQGIPHLMSLALSPSLATAAATMVSLWQCAASLSLWAPDPLSTKSHGPCKGRQHLVGVGASTMASTTYPHFLCAWFIPWFIIHSRGPPDEETRSGPPRFGESRLIRNQCMEREGERENHWCIEGCYEIIEMCLIFGRNEALWASRCIHLIYLFF